jgi:hypothetical protein
VTVTCPKCGRRNPDDHLTCGACRAPLPQQAVDRLQPLGEPPPPEPEAPPADPRAGSLGTPRSPEFSPSPTRTSEPKPSVKKGRSVTVTGAIVGALIGTVGTGFFVLTWWLANRDAPAPGAGAVFVAILLQMTSAAAVAGAVVGALSSAAGGGATAGAKVAAAMAGFFAVLWLASLAVFQGSLAVIGEQAWRALVAVGAATVFGGVIGAGAQAATDRWT